MKNKENKTKLCFFTAEYPFSSGETFIENEIEYLAEAFAEVLLFPGTRNGAARDLPANVKVEAIASSQLNFFDAFLIFKILFYEFVKMKKKIFFLRKIRTMIALIKKAVLLSRSIEHVIHSEQKNNKFLYYSYWMNEWAFALAILKDKNVIDKFVFRCGGYDIWDERHEGNYLPFRFYIYDKTSGIYPNSKMGETYLKKYNHYPEKIKCLYWGTKDKGLNPFNESQVPCIVSCSSLIPLKRVNKIIEILKQIDFPLKWVHFGDGSLKEELSEQVKTLPENIIVEMKGNVRNNFILDYYTKNSVTCFINASSTESLPVSIQEAISFGIPIIATNVGGVSEIVNDKTGLLLNSDFEAVEAAPLIKEMIFDQFARIEYRKKIRMFWLENFSAQTNYTEFVKMLKGKDK